MKFVKVKYAFLVHCVLQVFCEDNPSKKGENLKSTRQTNSEKSEELRDFRPTFSSGTPRFYRGPKYAKQNCTVLDEVLQADICTPAFETVCISEPVITKRIVETDYCFTVNNTVCVVNKRVVDDEVCTFEVETKEEASTAKTVVAQFDKKCRKQKVTVCDYAGYQNYDPYDPDTFDYSPICREVAQETCFNVPSVEPVDVPVTVTYPEPTRKCTSTPIVLPKVECHTETSKQCIKIPGLEDVPSTVDKCEPVLAVPTCQRVELILPKQVCQDIIFGVAKKQAQLKQQ